MNTEACHRCDKIVDKDKDAFYPQKAVIEKDKTIPVILCEPCMDKLFGCPVCKIGRPYCGDCI